MNKPPSSGDNNSLVVAPDQLAFENAVYELEQIPGKLYSPSGLKIQDYRHITVQNDWVRQLPESDSNYVHSITNFQNSALMVFHTVARDDARNIRENPAISKNKNLVHVQEQLRPVTDILFPNWQLYRGLFYPIYKSIAKEDNDLLVKTEPFSMHDKVGLRINGAVFKNLSFRDILFKGLTFENLAVEREKIVGCNEIFTLIDSIIHDSAKNYPIILKRFFPDAAKYYEEKIHMLYFKAYARKAPAIFGFPKENLKEDGCPAHFIQENMAYALQNSYQRQDIYDVLEQGTQEQALHVMLHHFISLVYEANNSLAQLHVSLATAPLLDEKNLFRQLYLVRHQLYLLTSWLSKTRFWEELLSRPLTSQVTYSQQVVSTNVQNAMPHQA